jgi:transposase
MKLGRRSSRTCQRTSPERDGSMIVGDLGIIHMLKCGGRWADCPAEYGPSTTVYNRWNRWSRRGIWTRILAALTEEGWIPVDRPDRQQLHQGPPLCRWHKRGARANAIGISRGGRTTKIHALVDVLGRPLRLVLTPGNTSDVKGRRPADWRTHRHEAVIADRGYDANRIRATLREQGHDPGDPRAAQPQAPDPIR